MTMHGNSLLKNRRLKIQGIKKIKQKMCYLEVSQCIFFSSAYPGLVLEATVVSVYAVIFLSNFWKRGAQRVH